jgi:hypothetical protein
MRLSYRLVVLWLPSKDLLLNIDCWLEAFSSEVLPVKWASWDTSIWSLSGLISSTLWNEVRESESLTSLVGLLALSHSLVSWGLDSGRLVAVESVFLEGTWTSLGAHGVAEAGKLLGTLLVSKAWSSDFTVSSSVDALTSASGSGDGWVALLDGGLGLAGEGEVALDELSKGVGVLSDLEESLWVNLGVGLIGNSDFSLGILTDVLVVDDDSAETFRDTY